MGMPFLKLDTTTTEFVATDWDDKEYRFAGTVEGAIALNHFCHDLHINATTSSDFNHPDEFPKFEQYAIDIAAGYFVDAIAAGVITLNESTEE